MSSSFKVFLTPAERERMLRFPEEIHSDDLAMHFMLTDADRRVVDRQRGDVSRLGFAITLGALRHLGFVPPVETAPQSVVDYMASQLGCASLVDGYAARAKTRTTHARRVLVHLGYRRATSVELEELTEWLTTRAETHQRPTVLLLDASKRLYELRIVRPGPTILERIVSAARQEAEQRTYVALGRTIRRSRRMLDDLLNVDADIDRTRLTWLRDRERRNSSPAICRVLDKHAWLVQHEVATWRLEEKVHRNRLKHLARLGKSASVQILARMPERRRYPVLLALAEQRLAEITDDLLDMLERRLLEIHAKAKEDKQAHERKHVSTRDAIVRSYDMIVRVLLNTRIPNPEVRNKVFAQSARDELRRLRKAAKEDARTLNKEGLDFIHESYRSVRIFFPRFLEQIHFHPDPDASPQSQLLEPLAVLRRANKSNQRTLPGGVPTEFVSKPWRRLVVTGRKQVDRKYYELAVLDSLGVSLRSGDLWVENSRRYASPGSYLMPPEKWRQVGAAAIRQLNVEDQPHVAIDEKMAAITELGAKVEIALEQGWLKEESESFIIPPLPKTDDDKSVEALQREVTARMPSVELPSLLVEVDRWTDFSQRVTHPNDGRPPRGDKLMHFYAAVLAQACNVGFTRMARSSSFTTDQIMWSSRWYLHSESLRPAFATLVDFQATNSLSRVWGAGTFSSSDGQRFPVAGLIREARALPRYFGYGRGVTFYTWVSDQFAQFGIKVTPTTSRDATYVLDEILDNETEIEILEHTVDTHGYTDLVFALFDLLGMRFAPRIRDVADARLWGVEGIDPILAKRLRVTKTIRRKKMVGQWDEMLRVAASLKQRWVTASLLVSKFNAQPKRGLAGALAEYGRICKTEHVLRYFTDVDYRRRIGRQLNKGEEVHGLRSFVLFGNRARLSRKDAEGLLNQAGCLNLVSNAVIVWNTIYMGRILDELRAEGYPVRDEDTARLSPCRYEHINHLGRYHFDAVPDDGEFRPTQRRQSQ